MARDSNVYLTPVCPVKNWGAGSRSPMCIAERPPAQKSIREEVEDCFHKLTGACSRFQHFVDAHVLHSDALSSYSLDISHCVNINAYLSSMNDFVEMNAAYTTFFGTSPPARACVAVTLPPPLRFQLDCIAYKEETAHDRQTIHVQGLSYWAPANIGPYSQTITVCARVLSFQHGDITTSSSFRLTSEFSFRVRSA
jgi:diphthine-ammonia ligase